MTADQTLPQVGQLATDCRGAVWEVGMVERDPDEPTITVQYRQVVADRQVLGTPAGPVRTVDASGSEA